MVGTMGLLLPAEGLLETKLGSLLAADLRTQSHFCDALATPTWKHNNVERKYFGI